MKVLTSIFTLLFTLNLVGCSDKKGETTISKAEPLITQPEAVEKQEMVEVAEKSEANTVAPKLKKTGEQLYAKCISCHGSKAEKSALNKSQIIQGWDTVKITDALKGYQNGSYGREMKGVMKGQIGSYNDEEIKLVSEFISKL